MFSNIWCRLFSFGKESRAALNNAGFAQRSHEVLGG